MNNKFYVSLEAAMLLKEKGYDRECVSYYQHEIFYPYSIDRFKLNTYNKNDAPDYMEQYSAPTKSEAIDWLEGHGIRVSIIYIEKDLYSYDVDNLYIDESISGFGHTRLEAEETAIIKALELL